MGLLKYTNIKNLIDSREIEIFEENEEIKKYKKEAKMVIVSKIAYLLGLDKQKYIEKGNYSEEIFNELENIKSAKIIRNLCILRNLCLNHFDCICSKVKNEKIAIFAI